MAAPEHGAQVLSARQITKYYPATRKGRSNQPVRALDGVDIQLASGETLGVVGESGSGKSTLAKMLVGRERPTGGVLEFHGRDLLTANKRERREARRNIQIVLQDASASLDPRMSVAQIVAEPWSYFSDIVGRAQRAARVGELLEMVGLDTRLGTRYPHELSGGQRQRVNIARALALRPEVLICDEPCSALDVSVQAQILNLLIDLQVQFGLSYIFISHNLAVAEYLSDRIAVMYLGRVVECGPQAEVYESPQHPYTQALLSAVPAVEGTEQESERRGRIVLHGEPPDPSAPPSGCPFHVRCWKAQDICSRVAPALAPVDSPTHRAACHFPGPTA